MICKITFQRDVLFVFEFIYCINDVSDQWNLIKKILKKVCVCVCVCVCACAWRGVYVCVYDIGKNHPPPPPVDCILSSWSPFSNA